MKKYKIPFFEISMSDAPYITITDKPARIMDQYQDGEFTFDDNGILHITAHQQIMKKESILNIIKRYANITGTIRRKHLKILRIKKTWYGSYLIPTQIFNDMQNEYGFRHNYSTDTLNMIFDTDYNRVYFLDSLKPAQFTFSNYRIDDQRENKEAFLLPDKSII